MPPAGPTGRYSERDQLRASASPAAFVIDPHGDWLAEQGHDWLAESERPPALPRVHGDAALAELWWEPRRAPSRHRQTPRERSLGFERADRREARASRGGSPGRLTDVDSGAWLSGGGSRVAGGARGRGRDLGIADAAGADRRRRPASPRHRSDLGQAVATTRRSAGGPARRRRPPSLPHERPGFQPDRVAMWAVLLGVLLVLVAATSSHAASRGWAVRSSRTASSPAETVRPPAPPGATRSWSTVV